MRPYLLKLCLFVALTLTCCSSLVACGGEEPSDEVSTQTEQSKADSLRKYQLPSQSLESQLADCSKTAWDEYYSILSLQNKLADAQKRSEMQAKQIGDLCKMIPEADWPYYCYQPAQ